MGAYLKEKLFALKEKYPCISDVRGIGLMVAIEFSHKDGLPGTRHLGKSKEGLLRTPYAYLKLWRKWKWYAVCHSIKCQKRRNR